jgi:3-hydroxyisobutyrate dehydrogenase-like beta-hydroxyacid dehydrogenase
MTKLAFLGLGAMGAPLASRLIEAGHQVTVWNRTRSAATPFEGRATIAESPADAARGVEAVITSLATPKRCPRSCLVRTGLPPASGPARR